jgi:hypothetical protein
MQSSDDALSRTALIALILLGLPAVLAAQQAPKMDQPDCGQYAAFVHVTTKEPNKRAIYRLQPDSVLLKQAGVHATITVKVFVSHKGRVVCASVVGDANPLLANISLEAART